MENKTLVVKHTSNYNMFNFLVNINRPVIGSHVNKLRSSILKMGVIRPIVVAKLSFLTGKEEHFIIDAQHLFFALQGLGLSIPYTEINVKDTEELIECIALLNASSKSWVLKNYVVAWQTLHSDYKILLKSNNETNIPFTALAAIAMNKTERSSLAMTIKAGKLRISNEQYEKIIAYAASILDILGGNPDGMIKERIVITFLQYFNNKKSYNHDQVLKRIVKHRLEILNAISIDALYDVLWNEVFKINKAANKAA